MSTPSELTPLLLSSSATGYQIERSLRFNSADTAYLSETFGTPTNNRIWTWSGWVKRSLLGSAVYGHLFSHYTSATANNYFYFNADTLYYGYDNGTVYALITTAVFRDPSAWYHVVLVVDTTNATPSERTKIYVNGIQQTVTGSYVPLNTLTYLNNSGKNVTIGRRSAAADQYFNGYMTEINFIDGQALTPSDFGETDSATGVWKPKAYSGTYGNNGFYLKFADNSGTTSTTLGKDSSGNGNNWTPNGFSVTAGAGNDSLVDTPTNNYCTLNPVFASTTSITNGALDHSRAVASWNNSPGSFGVTSGKWYFEVTKVGVGGTTDYTMVGVANNSATSSEAYTAPVNSWSYLSTGNKYGAGTNAAYGATFTGGDVIGVALDMDAGTITFYKNNVSQGVAYNSGLVGPLFPWVGNYANSGTSSAQCNFGQRPFAYTAPSGFKALCTQNLPTPTIGATSTTQAGKYFNAVTYTGNGTDGRTVTGVGFDPDLVWVKGRSDAGAHVLADAVRGSDKNLYTNLTDAETNPITGASGGGVGTVTTDGFVLEQGTVNMDLVNTNARTYVAWNWKANGVGVTNNDGNITSTVSASTTSGFSIVTYTGTLSVGTNPSPTVGHGLGVAPSLIISKSRNVSAPDGGAWHVNHVYNYNNYLRLNTTAAGASISGNGGGTPANPTSTVFSAYYLSGSGITGNNYVAYCFAPVAGYSAFGSYTGNGSADGPFVYTGFRPRYVLIKNSSATADWILVDTVRQTYNVVGNYFRPNTSNAEQSSGLIDIVSNGFKIRTDSSSVTLNALNTYIYAAFAESPFKYSLAR